MSLSRKKVEVDPLSFFIEEDQRKLHEEVEVDTNEMPSKEEPQQPVKNEIPTVIRANDTLPSKTLMNTVEERKKEVEFDPAQNQKSSITAKPILKKVENSPVAKSTVAINQKKPKDETPIDVLFSAEYNSKTEQLLNLDDDIFAVQGNSSKGDPSSASSINLNPDIDFKKTDDNDISDLKVAKLLEREQGLDESIFGSKSSSAAQSMTIQKKKNANTFDSEQQFLKELDEITAAPRTKYISSISRSTESEESSRVTTSTLTEKKIDIDLNALDINSYINQETNDSGGGLFD